MARNRSGRYGRKVSGFYLKFLFNKKCMYILGKWNGCKQQSKQFQPLATDYRKTMKMEKYLCKNYCKLCVYDFDDFFY